VQYSVLQELSTVNACRQVCVSATEMEQNVEGAEGLLCRVYGSEWQMIFVWVGNVADGTVGKLWHHCTQSVISHKP